VEEMFVHFSFKNASYLDMTKGLTLSLFLPSLDCFGTFIRNPSFTGLLWDIHQKSTESITGLCFVPLVHLSNLTSATLPY